MSPSNRTVHSSLILFRISGRHLLTIASLPNPGPMMKECIESNQAVTFFKLSSFFLSSNSDSLKLSVEGRVLCTMSSGE